VPSKLLDCGVPTLADCEAWNLCFLTNFKNVLLLVWFEKLIFVAVLLYSCVDVSTFTSAVLRVRQSVTLLLVQWPKFSPRPVHIGFVVGRVALGQGFLWVLWFFLASTIPPLFRTHSFSYIILATDRTFK
jgi:hypothetical protein